MGNQWFKFYGMDYLNSATIARLTPAERSCWITLMCYASMKNNEIEFLDEETLLDKSGVCNEEQRNATRGVLNKFVQFKMIKIEGDLITLNNFEKRQEYTMTSTERSRKFREKQREIQEMQRNATQCNANATLEEKRKEEKRIDKNKTSNADAVELVVPETLNLESWSDWESYRKERRLATYKNTSKKKQWEFLCKYSKDDQREIINTSIANNWQGLFPLKPKFGNKPIANVLKSDQTDDIVKKVQAKTIQA